jgi:hypothetical protein
MMTDGMVRFGLRYDPFEELDGSKDKRLQNYYVVPDAADLVWGDTPVLVFALPGGGKSALRVYTENIYRDSRGARFPVTYLPENYDTSPDFHLNGLKGAFARAILVYLFSYPDIFNVLPTSTRRELVSVFRYLPQSMEFILSMLQPGEAISTIEETLGMSALSGLSEFGDAHKVMAGLIEDALKNQVRGELSIEQIASLIKDSLGAKSIHVLIDGLDGFSETTSSVQLLAWVQPLLERVDVWQKQDIYLKVFLPMDISDTFPVKTGVSLQRVRLGWDDALLAELVRRRVMAASGGIYDSLDAISAPDLHDVELEIARQLPLEKKLPRQMILRTKKILSKAAKNADNLIHSEDLFQLTGA